MTQTPHAHDPLATWLTYLENTHPVTIDMGLARISAVKTALNLNPNCPIITVAGTNGKGSVCAMLTAIFKAAGYRVGTYTSPHLVHYNERVAINGRPIDDASLTQSFADIAQAQQSINTSLSYFEVGTLSAMLIFLQQKVDVIILEVGLGGRLDAANLFDADVAILTSVDLDHQGFLGTTREAIGHEKAGIFRPNRPAICADTNPPQSVIHHALSIGAELSCVNLAYSYKTINNQWQFQFGDTSYHSLPFPALRGDYQLGNAAAVLAALCAIKPQLPVSLGEIKQGLIEAQWKGRFQVLAGSPVRVLDAAHNPHAARALCHSLKKLPFATTRIAVFSMLSDKDIAGVVKTLQSEFDVWYLASLDCPRGLSAHQLADQLAEVGIMQVVLFDDPVSAWQAALQQAADNDRIVAFGSFYTLSPLFELLESTP
jgi:dihydrofolate synthase/folylpolyglutamate synthase